MFYYYQSLPTSIPTGIKYLPQIPMYSNINEISIYLIFHPCSHSSIPNRNSVPSHPDFSLLNYQWHPSLLPILFNPSCQFDSHPPISPISNFTNPHVSHVSLSTWKLLLSQIYSNHSIYLNLNFLNSDRFHCHGFLLILI
jgi:hypothetical protein